MPAGMMAAANASCDCEGNQCPTDTRGRQLCRAPCCCQSLVFTQSPTGVKSSECVPAGTDNAVPCTLDWFTPQFEGDIGNPTSSADSPWTTIWYLDLFPLPKDAHITCIQVAYRHDPDHPLGAISKLEDFGGIGVVIDSGPPPVWLVYWAPDAVAAVRAAAAAGERYFEFSMTVTFTVPPVCDLVLPGGDQVVYCLPVES